MCLDNNGVSRWWYRDASANSNDSSNNHNDEDFDDKNRKKKNNDNDEYDNVNDDDDDNGIQSNKSDTNFKWDNKDVHITCHIIIIDCTDSDDNNWITVVISIIITIIK